MTQVPVELWKVIWQLATGKAWPPAGPEGVTNFYEYANREMLLPLLMVAEGLPAEIAEARGRYRAFEAIYRKRYELTHAAIPTIQRVIGADTFVFLKGGDYCHRLYDRPDLRPMTDLDLLVPTAVFTQTLAAFAAAGYPQKRGNHGSPFSPDHHEASVLVCNVHVEVHRSLAQPARAAISYGELWDRRETFTADGIKAQRPSHPDAILLQAYELAKDEFSSPLIRYVDFLLLVLREPCVLPLCVERARSWQIERPLFGALFVTSQLLPSFAVPQVTEAMEALLTPRLRSFLRRHVLPDRSREHSAYPFGRLEQLRRKFMLMDNAWRRLRFLGFATQQEVKGSWYEWRARRAGEQLPPRWSRPPRS
ncbi:MAG TPA: nucleotidyltransferase family protein [Rhizomicrobium sp.]|nr:nucleotidyltransferase family protein [Rhizomicrobium sp.]